MRSMPGVMSRMPPLPVLLNEELATRMFPNSSQVLATAILEYFHKKGIYPFTEKYQVSFC